MRAFWVAGLALMAAPAFAQSQTADTTCSNFGGISPNWHCSTTISPPAAQPNLSGFGTAIGILIARRAQRRADKRAEEAAAKERAIDEAARPGIAQRIQAGDCHGALDYAVSHGSLSLAGDVAEYCQRTHPVYPD